MRISESPETNLISPSKRDKKNRKINQQGPKNPQWNDQLKFKVYFIIRVTQF